MPIKNKLFRLAFKLLSNRQEAEDAVQEVYLKTWNMRNNLEKYNSAEALMMTMTRNLCLDKLKSKKHRHQDLNSFHVPEKNADPYEQAAMADTVERVKQAIRNLPEQQKTIVHLRDVEGYELKEIAEIMGTDSNYVRVNLSRGRKKIREKLLNVYNHANG